MTSASGTLTLSAGSGTSVHYAVMVARARELWPEFPGMVDVVLWEVGRELCRPLDPECHQCFMAAACPSAKVAGLD